MSECGFDLTAYRQVLGCFATGVAVVTTIDKHGEKAGITISSFNTVSLDPPLVLWSIAKDSLTYEIFAVAEYFAVNVLAKHQQSICDRFAASGSDKFDGLDCSEGIEGVPLLPDFAASFECRTEHRYVGGDHLIVVGRVLKFEDRKTDPLIFYRGRFLT
ncbi:MAG: flavin reductase family protein [Proteobacteria bacterium]|nr:flavin reductase family protein [Pseudomonadota bacterium]